MIKDETVLEINKVSFSYQQNGLILEDISLNVNKGDRVGILGPNGAGKTSLFLLIAGIEKAYAGEVKLFGQKVVPGKFRPEIGMVFQNSDEQIFNPSVRDDIAFGPRNMGLSQKEVDERVQEALEILDISHLQEKSPYKLSGGEKRLVAIAGGILAMKSRFVIYDEPTSNLDIRYRRKLINFIQESHPEAMLVASHDLEFILEVCNRVIILDEGRIIRDGKPVVVLSDQKLMDNHSLEVPYSLLRKEDIQRELTS